MRDAEPQQHLTMSSAIALMTSHNTEGLPLMWDAEPIGHDRMESLLDARCAFPDRNLHSMMPLVPTPARL
jgi:hypothetical protein